MVVIYGQTCYGGLKSTHRTDLTDSLFNARDLLLLSLRAQGGSATTFLSLMTRLGTCTSQSTFTIDAIGSGDEHGMNSTLLTRLQWAKGIREILCNKSGPQTTSN